MSESLKEYCILYDRRELLGQWPQTKTEIWLRSMFCPEAIALSGGNAAEDMNGKSKYRIG
jgi:hypothetical protein